MPEGDTLYNTAATLRRALLGKAVTRFETPLPAVARADEDTPVAGLVVTGVATQAKHLLIAFGSPSALLGADSATDLVLHTHLRMTGSWHVYRHGERWRKPAAYAKVVIHTADLLTPCFSAPVVELLTARAAERHPDLVGLGPDAITDDFDDDEAVRRLIRHPDVEIAIGLLNQRLFSGVGNIFKSEVLFSQRVDPFVRIGDLDERTMRGLVAESHRLLRLNRGEGNRRTVGGLDPSRRLWVYGRSGEPCRVCGTRIRMRRQGMDARSTYYCPSCQSGGAART